MLAIAAAVVALLGLPVRVPASGATLVVHAGAPLGLVNHDLIGVGWHPGGVGLDAVADLHPRTVRIDASLQDVSPAPGELHLDALLDHVAEARAIGGDPLVILAYLPAWLGAPHALGRDPTRVAPADLGAWQRLVHDVVLGLATAPAPALRFEAWNEPDLPVFWFDTPAAWSAMVVASTRAIAQVEGETGLDLAFGGPATAIPDPAYLAAFLLPLRAAGLPADFVSWHYYGNTPFLGPDGNELPLLAPLHPILGQRNPLTTPLVYGVQAGLMRLLAGPRVPLLIDEWNLSPGGFDRRHDTHEGAAFAAASLIAMQDAGLDQAAYFQVDDDAGAGARAGGHGLVTHDGTRKPAWWALWLWQQQAARRVAVSGASPLGGWWATAAVDEDRATVLVASFSALLPIARSVTVELEGLPWTPASATVRRIDAAHPGAEVAAPVAVHGSSVRLALPSQAVALVEVRP